MKLIELTFVITQVDGAVKTTASFHEKHYPAFQNAKDQYLKVVEENVTAFREKGVKGTVNSAADAVLARTDGVVSEAKKLPGFVNKQTEVALDRVEDAFNQVTSYPIGERVQTHGHKWFLYTMMVL